MTKNNEKDPSLDENGRTWVERNGATVFGIGVFTAIIALGVLFRITQGA